MSSDPSIPPPPDDLESLLAAYMDHELDESSCRRVERMLAEDSQAGEMLRGMQQAWDALDHLERSEVDQQFTHTTMEMVAVAAEEEVRQVESGAARRGYGRWILGLLGTAVVGAAAFLAVVQFRPSRNEQLLRDLPVLEHLDEYRQIDNLEFLRLLHREGLFAKEAADES